MRTIITKEQQKVIDKAIAGTSWTGAADLVKRMKRQGANCWGNLDEIFANYERMQKLAAA